MSGGDHKAAGGREEVGHDGRGGPFAERLKNSAQ